MKFADFFSDICMLNQEVLLLQSNFCTLDYYCTLCIIKYDIHTKIIG